MSYAFIYDDILNDKRYERTLHDVEAKLTSLDIQGRMSRIALFRSAKDLVASMVSQGVTTIVVVGTDESLDKILWFLPDFNVTLGYLPIGDPSRIASLLGIPVGVGACEVLAARLVETVDVGRIDDRYFLTDVHLSQTTASVDIEGRFRLSAINGGSITIRNIGGSLVQSDAKDGMLEVIIQPAAPARASRRERASIASELTRVRIRHGEIVSNDPVDVHVDTHTLNGFRFRLGVQPSALKIITGRERRLAPLSKGPSLATLPTAAITRKG
jgi:hypothetical protein